MILIIKAEGIYKCQPFFKNLFIFSISVLKLEKHVREKLPHSTDDSKPQK